MGRVLSIHIVVFALLVAGCSSRRTEVAEQSQVHHQAGNQGKTKPKREEQTVAKTEKTGDEEQQEDAPPKKNWTSDVKKECHKALKGTAKFSHDLAMAAMIGVTVGLVLAVVFIAGAQ